ncbi:MAG: hypothetical protein K1X47_04905 [Cyclobacteriaceae bacterium]|nr:hypothetical protein [Cyclobacteriaceae bacterium]
MKSYVSVLVGAALFIAASTNAQLLNRLKQKAENKLENKLENALDKKLGTGNNNQNQNPNQNQNQIPGGDNNGNGQNGPGGNGNRSNKGGGGLISTPPDVNQNLKDADDAYKKGTFGEARYSIQQAMLGVELEIGNQILKSLPESIAGLKKDAGSDQVTSAGYGWAGLTIQRRYDGKDDKQLTTTIANNSAWMSAINMYFSAGGYAQQTNGQQNWKQIKIKGYRAIIEYSDGSGYKISVPIGQSSLLVYDGVNFSSEAEITAAANEIDIDGIKKMLGEQ